MLREGWKLEITWGRDRGVARRGKMVVVVGIEEGIVEG